VRLRYWILINLIFINAKDFTMKINRPYKERKPEITINKINQILSALDMNVLPIFWASPYDNIYSVRVEELKSGFGTNGKGTTKLFTLASAYAEFIERLQNLYHSGITGYSEVFLKKLKEKFGFHYYPDEKILSLDSLLNLPNNIKKDLLADNTNNYDETIKAIYRHLQDTNKKGVTGVPFYDLENAKIIYLPPVVHLGDIDFNIINVSVKDKLIYVLNHC